MSTTKHLTPHLFLLIDLLEANKTAICTDWVKLPTFQTTLKARKISIKKFRDGYAIPILEFFISVVKEENTLGNCPIMSKLVNYLVSKNITPKEVFDICIGLRSTLLSFLLKEEMVLKNPVPFAEEVALIFDANLSGVLDIFTALYSDAKKKIDSAKAQKLKLKQTLKIINFINTKIIIMQNGRIILANKPFLDMLGVDDLKALYAKYASGFEYLSEVNVLHKEFKTDLSAWVQKVYKTNRPFQCKIYNEKAKKKFNYSGRITHIPDDNIDQYIITFSNISEHIKDEKALQDLIEYDEITGFRNSPLFEKLIVDMIDRSKEDKSRLFLAVVDIPMLEEINDRFGRDGGDEVIAQVAEDLRFLLSSNIYLARLPGSRFGVLMQFPTEQASYDWCIDAIKKINEREHRKTLVITEVDLSESVNKLFLRAYDLSDNLNSSGDDFIESDFKNIIEYRELPEQAKFTQRLAKYNSIEMTLFYLGLSVASETKIVSTTSDTIKIKASTKQIKVAEIDTPLYFKLENIGFIKASVRAIDKDKQIITIDRFRFDKHTPLNRKLYRIEVQENIKAYIEDSSREYSVKILDMNYESIAIEIDRIRNFDINSLVFLGMSLPIDDMFYSCSLNATITRINKVKKGYKMVLLLHTDSENQNLLKQYISKHQISIIKDMLV